MDSTNETHTSVLSLSLHRLQRAPRAVHRAFLSRPTVFRVRRNISGLYPADAVAFLTEPSDYNRCLEQMSPSAKQAGPFLFANERLALFGNETLAVLFEGPIAHELVNLFQNSTSLGDQISSRRQWPMPARLDLANVEVGISRTWITRDQPPVIENERLMLAAIRSARRFIYAEVDALTSPVLVKALISRLKRDDAPEIVVVLPEGGLLQNAALAKIRKSDDNDRFRAYQTETSSGQSLLVIDDQLVSIGNLQWTSRSLGAQAAVNISIEALGRPTVVMAIARLRRERLGRRLKIDPSEFDARFLLNGTLIGTIESFFTVTRSLQELTPEATPWNQIAFSASPILDPKRPQRLRRAIIRKLKFGPKSWRFALILVSIFALLVMFSTLFAPLGL